MHRGESLLHDWRPSHHLRGGARSRRGYRPSCERVQQQDYRNPEDPHSQRSAVQWQCGAINVRSTQCSNCVVGLSPALVKYIIPSNRNYNDGSYYTTLHADFRLLDPDRTALVPHRRILELIYPDPSGGAQPRSDAIRRSQYARMWSTADGARALDHQIAAVAWIYTAGSTGRPTEDSDKFTPDVPIGFAVTPPESFSEDRDKIIGALTALPENVKNSLRVVMNEEPTNWSDAWKILRQHHWECIRAAHSCGGLYLDPSGTDLSSELLVRTRQGTLFCDFPGALAAVCDTAFFCAYHLGKFRTMGSGQAAAGRCARWRNYRGYVRRDATGAVRMSARNTPLVRNGVQNTPLPGNRDGDKDNVTTTAAELASWIATTNTPFVGQRDVGGELIDRVRPHTWARIGVTDPKYSIRTALLGETINRDLNELEGVQKRIGIEMIRCPTLNRQDADDDDDDDDYDGFGADGDDDDFGADDDGADDDGADGDGADDGADGDGAGGDGDDDGAGAGDAVSVAARSRGRRRSRRLAGRNPAAPTLGRSRRSTGSERRRRSIRLLTRRRADASDVADV